MGEVAKKISFVKPYFILSLDFELFWGVRDVRNLSEYGNHIAGVRNVLPQLLKIFEQYGIEATWATVGFLGKTNFESIGQMGEEFKQIYADENLNPYVYAGKLTGCKDSELLDLHFAPDLIQQILKTRGQELASHTFSHYYCLEKGQTAADFMRDLDEMMVMAKSLNTKFQSIVLPRNQVNTDYLPILAENGYTCYRGTPINWVYRADNYADFDAIYKKGLRFLDIFLPIFAIQAEVEKLNNGLINLPATRFLQPFAKRPFGLEKLKITRIKKEMTRAARNNKLYHLWWHPHNFGLQIEDNLAQCEEILEHFKNLKLEYGMESISMGRLAKMINETKE